MDVKKQEFELRKQEQEQNLQRDMFKQMIKQQQEQQMYNMQSESLLMLHQKGRNWGVNHPSPYFLSQFLPPL